MGMLLTVCKVCGEECAIDEFDVARFGHVCEECIGKAKKRIRAPGKKTACELAFSDFCEKNCAVDCTVKEQYIAWEQEDAKLRQDKISAFNAGYRQAMKDINTPMKVVQDPCNPSECPRCHKDCSDYEPCRDECNKHTQEQKRCPYCGQRLIW